MTSLRRTVLTLSMLVTLVGCDHATKYVAKAELQDQPPRDVIARVLELTYTENTDVGFGLLRWIPEGTRRPLLLAFGAVALVVLSVALLRAGSRASQSALALILAGALGNYLDRVFRGYVVDFIHVSHWPVFNVADIALSVGIALLAWTSLTTHRSAPAVSG